jgi:FG-GAP-like repeat
LRRTIAYRGALGLSFAGLSLAACADLPAVPSDSCGNGVVEQGEDCDTFVPDERFVCRPKGALGACRFDCSLGADEKRVACPAGWGCDERDLCREPTGDFASAKSYDVGPIARLVAGDFDGDGRADIVSQEPIDALAQGKLAFHYFDERGALAETRAFPKRVSSPVLSDLSGDERSDLVFSDFRVGLLLGRSDRRLVPETFSSYRLPDTAVRLVGVHEDYIRGAISLVTLGALEGTQCFSVPDSNTGKLRCLGDLPGPIEGAVADPVTGAIIEDAQSPCLELVLAMRAATSFLLVDVCKRDSVTGDPLWREQAVQSVIALSPEAEIDAAPQIVDMNGDGHLDVLIGAGQRAYVAYGDGAGLKPATPYSFELEDFDRSGTVSKMPLAAGDFSGDGTVDFVFDDQLVVSLPRFGGGAPRYQVALANLGLPLTVAKIADLNGDGKIDAVGASSLGLGIDVFSGTGGFYVTETSIPTEQPVLFLGVGDFDGDLTNDLAFVEQAATGETRDSLSIAFGTVGRPPQDPVPVARLSNPEQLSVCRWRGRGNLLVASSQTEPARFGGVTWLDGSPDRIPFSPYTLVSFSDDGQVVDYPAVALTVGAFSGPGHGDVVALASVYMQPFQFWFVRDLERGQSTPVRLLDGTLDPSFTPLGRSEGDEALHLTSASGDLDGDGQDEALWALPGAADHCTILAFDVDARSTPTLVPYGTLEFAETCADPQLSTFDADADGALDILLLTGKRGANDRKLRVLWNDGDGGFAENEFTKVNDPSHSPEAFATLAQTTARPLSIVYVARTATDQTAFASSSLGDKRSFEVRRPLTTLKQGRGLTAADINGDGAEDLVFADGSKLTVLLAELKTP